MCPMWLSSASAQKVETLGMLYLRCFSKLAEMSYAQGVPRWKHRPKVHALRCQLLCQMRSGSRLNPRFTSTFNDEDYVGRLCRVSRGAMHSSTMARRILERSILLTNTHLQEEKVASPCVSCHAFHCISTAFQLHVSCHDCISLEGFHLQQL